VFSKSADLSLDCPSDLNVARAQDVAKGHVDGLKSWIEAAKKRLHHKVLAIALAKKNGPVEA
jgi:hypothetical protein